MFREELIEFILAFMKSRRWWRLLMQGTLLMVLPVVVGGFVLYGASIPVNDLGGRYITSVSAEVERRFEAMEAGEDVATTDLNSEIRISLERILQLGDSNERVAFIVAEQLSSQGRVESAAKKMREIAPAGGAGFPLAHAWLANYEKARFDNTKEMAELMLNDLTVANNALASMPAELTALQVQLLVSLGKPTDALDIASLRAQQNPSLYAAVAELAAALNDKATLREAVEQSRQFLKEAYVDREKDENFYTQHARLEDYENDLDGLLKYAKQGSEAFPESKLLGRFLSNALLVRFVRIKNGREEGEPERDYLGEAYRADPENPAVMVQIATAISLGQSTDEELRTALQKRLDEGSASGVIYLVLGNDRLSKGDMEGGIDYLRKALETFPDAPVVQNNLAYALLQLDPPNVDEALEIAEKASLNKTVARAYRASILDTLGEARALKGDSFGAIESYEETIQADPNKISTREKLIALYEAAGMSQMAEVQQERVAELKQQQ